ncbi:arylamine N-acetyltransferase [Natronospirillum operosum]|uniref:Arylamine N-acetyltransferase n=2 Tax=Natronospirillum operosum TaxID=2759953 RepID=A0A4Z0W946_9GAMM|nr:arylamine N-acetyltransferase [Natronospirillum operosum]
MGSDSRSVPHAPDIEAYFSRIGYSGPRRAILDTLQELQFRHLCTIPFENLSPFLGHPVRLDMPALEAKILHSRRGGYCFEQNMLVLQVLQALGFSVRGLAARVLWGQPEGTLTPRTHMLLCVELDGKSWLVDVGFGGQTHTAPLLLEPGLVQTTPHERYRVLHHGGYFHLQAEVLGQWRSLYCFDLSDQHDVDYELANYYVATKPDSHFVTGLVAARARPGGRCALSGNRLTRHYLDRPSEERVLETPDELMDTLETVFDIAIPDRAELKAVIARKGIIPGFR